MAISTVEIVPNDNFVVLDAEDTSNTVAAVFSTNVTNSVSNPVSLLSKFANSGEKENGYMIFTSLSDWINRYVETYSGLTHKDGAVISSIDAPFSGQFQTALPDCTGVSSGVSCFNGATGQLAKHWWGVHNYLQYGGSCVISGALVDATLGVTWSPTGNNPLVDKTKVSNIDVAYALDHGATQGHVVYYIVMARNRDCIGIIGASGTISGFGEPVDGVGGQTSNLEPAFSFGNTYSYYGVCVAGNKEHFGLENSSLDIISTPLMPDVAGCMARTDRDSEPWYSPAGFSRGRILNVLRIPDLPSNAVQSALKARNVNYVLTLNGQGTFLFSDKTMNMDVTNPLENINVSRLYVYLAKTIGPIANQYLFEFNNSGTRTSFTTAVNAILEGIRANNGITDYDVICDESNNPQSVIDNNEFVADITITPSRSINTITIRFTNQTL